ncbi:hypothetical protein JHK87_018768 [Glycine soja]|nr:hypothetical protein JHK87_018768 [Glycine soja]
MYFNAPAVEPSSSTRPNELEFTTEPGLPNKELGPFSENEGKVLHNQPYEEDYKKDARLVSLITTTTLHMKIFEETYFQDFEYRHSLDHEEVQHPVGTLFEGMHLLTKQDVQNALQQKACHPTTWSVFDLRQARVNQNVSNVYKSLFGKLHNKPIGHRVTSQCSPLTQKRKEVLRIVLSPHVSTPKWISENQVNQSDVLCVA